MTSLRLSPFVVLFVGLLPLLNGCGNDSAESEVQFPDWLAEEDSRTDTSESSAAAGTAPTPSAPPLDTAALDLKLNPGDRFPLRKVVEQELKQSSLNGQPQVSRSRLDLLLAITVAEIREGHTLMQVQYDRVRYSHEVAGERITYDSTNPPQDIPAPAVAYHGMVGDGFSFWIGADNQIAQVIGFREFVERCLSHIPEQQRQQAMLDIEASAGEKGIADFVDNTIGLLPRDVEKVTGDSWEKTRHIARPIPMQINTVYTLSGFNEQTADVTIGGTITPSTTLGGTGQDDPQVRITVTGGRSSGRCTIFRDSGLPKQSQVERIVDMTVQMAGGIEFEQQKRTVTTVESYPQQSLAGATDRPMFR